MGYLYSKKKNSFTKTNNSSTSSRNERNYKKNEAEKYVDRYLHGTCSPPLKDTVIK